MDKLRKEIKKKFASLTVNQLGLIGYWFKLSRDLDFNYIVGGVKHGRFKKRN